MHLDLGSFYMDGIYLLLLFCFFASSLSSISNVSSAPGDLFVFQEPLPANFRLCRMNSDCSSKFQFGKGVL